MLIKLEQRQKHKPGVGGGRRVFRIGRWGNGEDNLSVGGRPGAGAAAPHQTRPFAEFPASCCISQAEAREAQDDNS